MMMVMGYKNRIDGAKAWYELIQGTRTPNKDKRDREGGEQGEDVVVRSAQTGTKRLRGGRRSIILDDIGLQEPIK